MGPEQYFLRNRCRILHIGTGEILSNGRILVKNGIIEAVGSQSEIEAPNGAIRWGTQVVTPGFIDAHTVVGLAGYLGGRR